ncbi:hypothetical protein D3C87_1983540 [compost metagenome]
MTQICGISHKISVWVLLFPFLIQLLAAANHHIAVFHQNLLRHNAVPPVEWQHCRIKAMVHFQLGRQAFGKGRIMKIKGIDENIIPDLIGIQNTFQLGTDQ